MRTRCTSGRNAALLTLFSLVLNAGASPAITGATGKGPFTGEWGWAVDFEKGLAVGADAKFTQDGDKLTGQVRFGDRKPLPITQGRIDGRKIQFQVEDAGKETAIRCRYTGELKDGKIKGTVRLSIPAPAGDGKESESNWEGGRMEVPISW